MNPYRKAIIWTGAVLAAAIGMYPPWQQISSWKARHYVYGWLFAPPYNASSGWTTVLDTGRLEIEWSMLVVLVGTLLFAPLSARDIRFAGRRELRWVLVGIAGLVLCMYSGWDLQFISGRAMRFFGINRTVEDLGRLVKHKFPGVYDGVYDTDLGRLAKMSLPHDYDDFADIGENPFLNGEAVRAALAPLTADASTKLQAWVGYYLSHSPDEFRTRFDNLSIPRETKRALWDLKFPVQAENWEPKAVTDQDRAAVQALVKSPEFWRKPKAEQVKAFGQIPVFRGAPASFLGDFLDSVPPEIKARTNPRSGNRR